MARRGGCQAKSAGALPYEPEATEPDGPHYEVEDESGDSWIHEAVIERIDPPDPESPSAEGRAGGYERFLDAIGDPRHPEHEDLLAWAGGRFDGEAFR